MTARDLHGYTDRLNGLTARNAAMIEFGCTSRCAASRLLHFQVENTVDIIISGSHN